MSSHFIIVHENKSSSIQHAKIDMLDNWRYMQGYVEVELLYSDFCLPDWQVKFFLCFFSLHHSHSLLNQMMECHLAPWDNFLYPCMLKVPLSFQWFLYHLFLIFCTEVVTILWFSFLYNPHLLTFFQGMVRRRVVSHPWYTIATPQIPCQ